MLKVWAQHLVERPEGDVGRHRDRPAGRAHRYRRAVGKNREAASLALNPNGLVPTMRRRTAITSGNPTRSSRYLAARHKSSLDAPDPRVRAHAEVDGLAARGDGAGDRAALHGWSARHRPSATWEGDRGEHGQDRRGGRILDDALGPTRLSPATPSPTATPIGIMIGASRAGGRAPSLQERRPLIRRDRLMAGLPTARRKRSP